MVSELGLDVDECACLSSRLKPPKRTYVGGFQQSHKEERVHCEMCIRVVLEGILGGTGRSQLNTLR